MTKYLLDTNIVSYLHSTDTKYHINVTNRLSTLIDSDKVYISILSLYELEFGISTAKTEKTRSILKNIKEMICHHFLILPLSKKGAHAFGELKRAYSQATGINKKIAKRNDVDFMLAGTAIIEQAVIVSNDSIFESLSAIYPDLKFENWVLPIS